MRHGFRVRLQPEAAADYLRLHDPVPGAVLQQLEVAGIRNYSIFLDGDDVFGSLAYEDRARLRRALSYDAAPEWAQAVAGLMTSRTVDSATGLLQGLPEVFSMGWDA